MSHPLPGSSVGPAWEAAPGLIVQGFTLPLRLRDFKLAAFDMVSTLINIECVNEIADAVGKKAEVAINPGGSLTTSPIIRISQSRVSTRDISHFVL